MYSIFLHKFRFRLWEYLSRLPGERISFRRGGIRWTAFRWDKYVARILFTYGKWQFREIELVLDWITAGDPKTLERGVIINAGAFIGTTAIHLTQVSNARVLAIEPIGDFFEVLQLNVANNQLQDRIACSQRAVFDEAQELMMSIPEINPGGSEISSEDSGSPIELDFPIRKRVKVQGEPLDKILEANQITPTEIKLVWADAQGCEGHLIRTGTALWESGVPLVIEFWPRGLLFQEKQDILPLIRKHFSSFCVLPGNWTDAPVLREQPIGELDYGIVGVETHVDLLLIAGRG